MADYKMLKSGTDIRGRAIASESSPAVLTDSAVADIAAAFVLWLTRRTGKQRCKLVIGRDCRLTGENFVRVIVNALRTAGQEIYDCGIFSTPAAFLVTKFPTILADGAIMITASHHPKEMNGLKFFTADGGVNSEELSEIIALAEAGEKLSGGMFSSVVRRDCMRLYCDALTDAIRKGTGLFMPLKNMKIVVDAGHGVGGFFATRVLQPLGADVSASQFLEPDGNFPAHAPNPEDKAAMESLKNRVLDSGADLGIIFDADADRSAVVAADGTEINRSRLIALAAAIVLPDHPGATIVTDSVTTEGLREFIQAKGGVQKRFKRGYRNVIDEAKRLNKEGIDAPIAIESSGHAAFSEHYFLDDGAYFVAKILVTMSALRRSGGELTDLIAGLKTPKEDADIRLRFVGEGWRVTAERIITRLTALSERMLRISDDNYEGVRAYVPFADGYFIVRTSVHDPVLPIYIESDKPGGVMTIAKFLRSFLFGFRDLDCAPLEEFIASYAEPQPPAEEQCAAEDGSFAAEECDAREDVAPAESVPDEAAVGTDADGEEEPEKEPLDVEGSDADGDFMDAAAYETEYAAVAAAFDAEGEPSDEIDVSEAEDTGHFDEFGAEAESETADGDGELSE